MGRKVGLVGLLSGGCYVFANGEITRTCEDIIPIIVEEQACDTGWGWSENDVTTCHGAAECFYTDDAGDGTLVGLEDNDLRCPEILEGTW